MSPWVPIISAFAAVVTLVFAIFAASWLNQRATEKLLEQMDQKFEARFQTILTEIKRLDQRIDAVEQRLGRLETQIDERLSRIERQLEAIFKPILPPR